MKKSTLFLYLLLCISALGVAQKEATGVISSVNGKLFTVKVEQVDPMPGKQDTCSISKDISGSKNPFGLTVTSGWMGIGEVQLTGTKGNTWSFKIIKETSSIVINGKKQLNFVVGKKVKIEWKGK